MTLRMADIRSASFRERASDLRVVERGCSCMSKSKQDLLILYEKLGGKTSELDELKLKNLCDEIRNRIVELEMSERRKGTDVKYMYGWWDQMVDTTLIVR